MDVCLTQACEAAGRCRLRAEEFAGGGGARMCRLHHAGWADDTPATKRSDNLRKKAHRNISALPKHLPPVSRCSSRRRPRVRPVRGTFISRRGRQRGAGRDPDDPASATYGPSQRLPQLTDGTVQARELLRLIESGIASTVVVIRVVVSKFAWYLPLYRQVQILAG